jgi:hypothetical protein
MDETAPATASPDTAVGDIFLITLLALGVFALFASQQGGLSDGDTSWHVGAGRWIWEHGTVPSVDPFSFQPRAERGPRMNG